MGRYDEVTVESGIEAPRNNHFSTCWDQSMIRKHHSKVADTDVMVRDNLSSCRLNCRLYVNRLELRCKTTHVSSQCFFVVNWVTCDDATERIHVNFREKILEHIFLSVFLRLRSQVFDAQWLYNRG